MRAFADRHPQIELILDVGNRHEVLDRLRAHTVDVAVSGTPPSRRSAGRRAADGQRDRLHHVDRRSGAGLRRLHAADLADRVWLLREPGLRHPRPQRAVPGRPGPDRPTRSRSAPTAPSSRPPASASASPWSLAPRSRPSWTAAAWPSSGCATVRPRARGTCCAPPLGRPTWRRSSSWPSPARRALLRSATGPVETSGPHVEPVSRRAAAPNGNRGRVVIVRDKCDFSMCWVPGRTS